MTRASERCKGVRDVLHQPSPPANFRAALSQRIARWRAESPRRLIGIVAALLVELLLVAILLTLSPKVAGPQRDSRPTVFRMSDELAREQADEASVQQETPQEQATAPEQPRETPPLVPTPIVPPVARMPDNFIPLTREQMVQADITPPTPPAAATSSAPKRVYGPPNTGGGSAFADTPRVSGSGPNGEPLYAAAWYREPYPEELRGYLSTASGPGWALIACRTVREWRVEDCVKVDESPEGSNIARAVLAAAWQFKVRPPRIGGELRYGEWVRIRIDYELRQR